MNDNEVTITASEYRRLIANDINGCGVCPLKKERDELKAKLESGNDGEMCGKCTIAKLSNERLEKLLETKRRLADAERCIDEIMNELQNAIAGDSIKNVNKAKKLIRVYRAKKGGAK